MTRCADCPDEVPAAACASDYISFAGIRRTQVGFGTCISGRFRRPTVASSFDPGPCHYRPSSAPVKADQAWDTPVTQLCCVGACFS